jgi:hypothetical protein
MATRDVDEEDEDAMARVGGFWCFFGCDSFMAAAAI